MANITLRQVKGVALSHQELDDNFSNINTEVGTLTTTVAGKVASVGGTAGRISVSGTTAPSVDLASGVATPGSATLASITVDTYGRVTAYSSGTAYTNADARGSVSGGTGITYSSSTGVIAVDTTTIATRTYADSAATTAVANVIDAAPTTLDTLNELAAALGDDPNFATTVTTSLGNKLNTSAFTSTADTWLGTKSTSNLSEGTNQYFTTARARTSVSAGTGISYNNSTGVITSSITQYTDANARTALSGGTGISYNNSTGVITSSITQYTDANARAALSGTTGISYNSSTGAITLANTAVVAGSYSYANIAVDAQGRITSASNGATPLTSGGALGTPASGNLSNCSADGTNSVGFRSIPSAGAGKTSSYTLANSDRGEFVQVDTGGSIVVPQLTFAAGDVVVIYNNTAGAVTITTSNLAAAYISGVNTSRTSVSLASRGVCNILYLSATTAVLSGNIS